MQLLHKETSAQCLKIAIQNPVLELHMKKTLCALSIGATILTPMMASAADVKIYGRANVSLDYLDNGADYKETNLVSNSSRLGFKVDHEIQPGLNAFAQIEQEINFASGSKDSKGIDFATRDTFVGLKSDTYGQVQVGRFDSPFKKARGPVNFFGDQLGDMRNVTRVGDLRFDERNANTIEYKSPKLLDGLNILAALSLYDGVVDGTTASNVTESKKKTHIYDIAATYKTGAWDTAIAYEYFQENADSKGKRQSVRAAAAYDITKEFKLGGLYQFAKGDKDSIPNVNIYGLAGTYKLTPKTSIMGEYFYRDVDATQANSSLIALGIEHKLDKAVRVYANVATALNDDNAKITPWQQGRSTETILGAAGKDATGVSMGFRYDF